VVAVSRLAGLVLPASSKYLIDDVIGAGRADLLAPLALAVGAATFVQAVTSFALSQVLGVAAQRAITDMRRRVEAHVARLPVSYFDSTKAGVLISRVMNDADGIRNLVGTGLVQLTGGLLTAILALSYLFYLNCVPDDHHARRAWRLRRRDGDRVQAPPAALPRARQDQRGGDRPAQRNARRHPHRQDLHRREA
jgi:ABC-type multidrug transport system fused ATPase/permease subunit